MLARGIVRGVRRGLGVRQMSTGEVPTISVAELRATPYSEEKARAVAEKIDQAACDIGFMTIVDHGVNQDAIKAVWKSTQEFFALDEAEKMKWRTKDDKEYPYGYVPIGGELLSAGTEKEKGKDDIKYDVTDPKEMFSLGPGDPAAGMPPRRIPDKPASFRPTWEAYYDEMVALADDMLVGFALALGRDKDFFKTPCVGHRSAMRALSYPSPTPGRTMASTHTDYGTMTLLRYDAPGLEVQRRDGVWVPVPVVPDAYVVNLGDLMSRWTNGRWLSTPHRVVGTDNSDTRTSIAFFHNVNANTVIDSADFAHGEEPKFPKINAYDFLLEKYLASVGKDKKQQN